MKRDAMEALGVMDPRPFEDTEDSGQALSSRSLLLRKMATLMLLDDESSEEEEAVEE